MEYGLAAVLAAFILREILGFLERRAWQKERAALIDRIQSGSLSEYKMFEQKPEKEPQKDEEPQIDYV